MDLDAQWTNDDKLYPETPNFNSLLKREYSGSYKFSFDSVKRNSLPKEENLKKVKQYIFQGLTKVEWDDKISARVPSQKESTVDLTNFLPITWNETICRTRKI